MREYHAILELGDSIFKYESYGSYRLDSALVGKQQMTLGEFLISTISIVPTLKNSC